MERCRIWHPMLAAALNRADPASPVPDLADLARYFTKRPLSES